MPGMARWYPVTVSKVHSGIHWDFTDVLAKGAAFWPLEAANYQWCCSLLSPQCPEGTPWSIPGLEEDASPLPGHRSNTTYILVSHNVTQSPLWKKLLQCLPAVILSRASIPSFRGWPREHYRDSATFPNFSFPLGLGHPVSFLLQPTKPNKTKQTLWQSCPTSSTDKPGPVWIPAMSHCRKGTDLSVGEVYF